MKNKINLVTAGGRNFTDYDFFKKEVDTYLQELEPDELLIIWGGAKGTDSMGKRYADDYNIEEEEEKADWSKYGRAAGPIRNKVMAEKCTHLIAFWDGKSKGTKSMISLAEKNNKTVKVVSI